MNLPLTIPNLADLVDALLVYGFAITLTLMGLRGVWAYLRKELL